MLMKNDYDFQQATAQIKNGNKQSDETWTDEDQEALGLAFGVVEKNFTALARMVRCKRAVSVEHIWF